MNFLETYQNAILVLAEQKLGRTLTEKEILGIKNIHSTMFLEVVERSWTEDLTYTAEKISEDLIHFAKLPEPFKI